MAQLVQRHLDDNHLRYEHGGKLTHTGEIADWVTRYYGYVPGLPLLNRGLTNDKLYSSGRKVPFERLSSQVKFRAGPTRLTGNCANRLLSQ